jgi:hypothetical protein
VIAYLEEIECEPGKVAISIDAHTGEQSVDVIEKGVSSELELRDKANMLYYIGLQESVATWPSPFKHKAAHLKLI